MKGPETADGKLIIPVSAAGNRWTMFNWKNLINEIETKPKTNTKNLNQSSNKA